MQSVRHTGDADDISRLAAPTLVRSDGRPDAQERPLREFGSEWPNLGDDSSWKSASSTARTRSPTWPMRSPA